MFWTIIKIITFQKCQSIISINTQFILKKSPELFENNFEIKIVDHISDIVTDPNVIIGVNDQDFDTTMLIEHKKKKEIKENDI